MHRTDVSGSLALRVGSHGLQSSSPPYRHTCSLLLVSKPVLSPFICKYSLFVVLLATTLPLVFVVNRAIAVNTSHTYVIKVSQPMYVYHFTYFFKVRHQIENNYANETKWNF